jgi:hypothetical protein
MPERIRREDNEIRGEGRCVGFEVEDLRGGGADNTEEGAEDKDAEGERGEGGVVCRWDGLGRLAMIKARTSAGQPLIHSSGRGQDNGSRSRSNMCAHPSYQSLNL